MHLQERRHSQKGLQRLFPLSDNTDPLCAQPQRGGDQLEAQIDD